MVDLKLSFLYFKLRFIVTPIVGYFQVAISIAFTVFIMFEMEEWSYLSSDKIFDPPIENSHLVQQLFKWEWNNSLLSRPMAILKWK